MHASKASEYEDVRVKDSKRQSRLACCDLYTASWSICCSALSPFKSVSQNYTYFTLKRFSASDSLDTRQSVLVMWGTELVRDKKRRWGLTLLNEAMHWCKGVYLGSSMQWHLRKPARKCLSERVPTLHCTQTKTDHKSQRWWNLNVLPAPESPSKLSLKISSLSFSE